LISSFVRIKVVFLLEDVKAAVLGAAQLYLQDVLLRYVPLVHLFRPLKAVLRIRIRKDLKSWIRIRYYLKVGSGSEIDWKFGSGSGINSFEYATQTERRH
jgi:hypothetical protein